MQTRAQIRVKGIVQGVGFRYFVYRRALQYNLGGYVSNLPSGDVEILAEGERSALEQLIADVKVGPRSSSVTDVFIEWKNADGTLHSFDIK